MENLRDVGLALAGVVRRLDAHERELTRLDALVRGRIPRWNEALQVAGEAGLALERLDGLSATERRQVALALRGRGWSYREIMQTLGVSHMAVARYMRRSKCT